MDLSYTDEQRFLRESIRGTVEREAPLGRVREWVLDPEPPAWPDHDAACAIARRQGWSGIGVAEELGGQGGELLEQAILAEELGRGAVPADALYASLLAAHALTLAGEAGHGLVASLATGERLGALVHPGAVAPGAPGAPLAAGRAVLVLGGERADVLLALTGGALARYERDAAQRTPRRLVDRTRAVADVVLGGEPAELLGVDPEEISGLAARAAVLAAADALGAAQRMLELTVEYVADRVQFGVAVGSFQAVKHTAAEMLVAIEGTRAAVEYAAWAVGAGEPGAHTDAWVAKSRASRMATFVADKALFLHGAVGYTWEHDLQLLFKRAKSDAELFGGAGFYDERIADHLRLAGDGVS